MRKTLVSKTPPGEFQVIALKESTNKKNRLQAQRILPYMSILNYLPTIEPIELYQSQF